MARLFVAARPPADVVERLRTLPRPTGEGCRWVPEEQWHVTLRFLGECDRVAAVDALGRLDHPPAEAVLGPTVQRLGERVVCVPVGGVDGLAGAVRSVTDPIAAAEAPEPFRGHLTLGRLRRGVTTCELLGTPVAARFRVDRVVLVESTPDPTGLGHHHQVVADRRLG